MTYINQGHTINTHLEQDHTVTHAKKGYAISTHYTRSYYKHAIHKDHRVSPISFVNQWCANMMSPCFNGHVTTAYQSAVVIPKV